jgi:3-phosphoshikimate 1-carboxyvinyltransferase
VVVDDVYVGPGRTGFLDFLQRMGADVERVGERTLRARYSPDLHGTGVLGKDIPGLVDEIPVLAVAGAVASDSTAFVDVGELRLKESDRIATVIEALAAVGATATYGDEGLVVRGGTRLRGGTAHSHWDHRIAMALAVAGMAAEGTTVIHGWEAVATSYPGFERDLEQLCGS